MLPLQVIARLHHRLTEQADLAAIVGEQLQDAIDGGRLSTAVRSEQAEDLARCDLEREVIERHRASVAFDKVLDGYDRFHGIPLSSYKNDSAFLMRIGRTARDMRRNAHLVYKSHVHHILKPQPLRI